MECVDNIYKQYCTQYYMDIILTEKQIKMLELAEEQGHLTLNDTYKFYSDERYRQNALSRLVMFGYLKDIGFQRFEFVKAYTEQEKVL